MRLRTPSRAERRGSVLVEFSLIALVLVVLTATVLDLGRAVHSAQLSQQAADVLARELARVPLPATITFEEALRRPEVKSVVYDDDLLQVPLPDGMGVADFFAGKPVVNQLLAPLMIVDGGASPRVARYPGIVKDDVDGRWKVPVRLEGAGGLELVPVVEEVRADGAAEGPFSLVAPGDLKGFVAVRVNYPFQAAGMVAYHPQATTGGRNVPVEAPPLRPGEKPGPYGGDGRGALLAHGTTVRPFRRLVTGQAVYRRELFAEAPAP